MTDSYTTRILIRLQDNPELEATLARYPGLLPLIMEAAGGADQQQTLNAALQVLTRLIADPVRLNEIIDTFELEETMASNYVN